MYGLTPEQYDAKLAAQEGICLLCLRPMDLTAIGLGRGPALDHIHDTKPLILRDFLHGNCNKAVGLFEDNPEICRLAALYLERHAQKVI
jgi:hypothetical protein